MRWCGNACESKAAGQPWSRRVGAGARTAPMRTHNPPVAGSSPARPTENAQVSGAIPAIIGSPSRRRILSASIEHAGWIRRR